MCHKITSKISVSDKICVFGILKLDKDLNLHIMDNPVAFVYGNMAHGLEGLKNAIYERLEEQGI